MSLPTRRHYRRWFQLGVSDAIAVARSTFVPKGLADAPGAGRGGKSSSKEAGLSIAEIVERLRQFTQSRDNRAQSVVLAGTCQLAKENTNGLRGVLALPTPMPLGDKILVFTGPENRQMALEQGADVVGGDELLNDLLEDKLKFDRVIATTDMLPLVTKLARVLGPRGLMPSVKTGTLTVDLKRALRDARANVPFRIEKFTGVFSVPVAKTVMKDKEIEDNVRAAVAHILGLGQSGVKKGCFLTKVSVVSHGSFVHQIAQSEYWSKPQRVFGPIATAPIPDPSTVPVNHNKAVGVTPSST